MFRKSFDVISSLYCELERISVEKNHYENQLKMIKEDTEIRSITFVYTKSGLHTFDINLDYNDYFIKSFKSYLNNIINIKNNEIKQIEKELDTYRITKVWRED